MESTHKEDDTMTATFIAFYIIDDANGMAAMTRDDVSDYIENYAADRDFTVWHIQPDVAPRDVTEDMIENHAPVDNHNDLERHGWEQV